jgi:hypothetical protein
MWTAFEDWDLTSIAAAEVHNSVMLSFYTSGTVSAGWDAKEYIT